MKLSATYRSRRDIMGKVQKGSAHWDGTRALDFIADDGGRAAAGYRGRAGDCVTRSIAIALCRPYAEVYDAMANGMGTQRKSKGRTARNGVSVTRKWFKDWMVAQGFTWHPTMSIGSGCTVHLLAGELPPGRLVVSVSGHYTAVIDGVIHDTYNPTRAVVHQQAGGTRRMSHRCVYGYWRLA